MTTVPRGMRVNNPLNIDRNEANKWQGRLNPGDPKWNKKEKRFEQFSTLVYGLRAGATLIIGHFDGRTRTAKRRGPANTIRKLIHIWAPPTENKTDKYAETVAKWSGIDVDAEIDLHDYKTLRPVMEAMVRYEQAGPQPITEAQWQKALALAGVEPERSLVKSRTVGGGTVATAGVGGSGAIEMIQSAQDAVSPLTDYLEIAKWAMLGLILLGVGISVYARWDDLRKLAR